MGPMLLAMREKLQGGYWAAANLEEKDLARLVADNAWRATRGFCHDSSAFFLTFLWSNHRPDTLTDVCTDLLVAYFENHGSDSQSKNVIP